MVILPNAIYRFNAIPIKIPRTHIKVHIKIPRTFFHGTNNFKICMESQKTVKSKQFWGRRIKLEGITLPYFTVYYKATVIKIIRYWHNNGFINQWDRIENPEMNSHLYDWVIYDKGGKNIKWEQYNFFNRWCWENMQKNQTGLLFHAMYKNKFKID